MSSKSFLAVPVLLILLALPVFGFVDLSVNQTIIFSDNNPAEGENVIINATITNHGNDSALNVFVLFLEDSIEFANITLNVSASEMVVISEPWIAEIGLNNITVIADPANLISESNENNNMASAEISIDAYHTYYGTLRSFIGLGIDSDFLLNHEKIGCNLLVADTDSNVDFSSLQAIGRRKNVGPALNDFIDIDTLLGMTNFDDSISALWTLYGQFSFQIFKLFPREVETFTLFGTNITNVPVINSTNSSAFRTGILWDTSDDTGGFFGQFDTVDREDIVLVTKAGPLQQGKFGIYNYEIKVPSLIRDYKPGSSTVDFFIDVDASQCS